MTHWEKKWEAKSRQRYAAALARGEHDNDCERRERYGLCGCGQRKRIASGLTEAPELWHHMPVCGNCALEVDHDGDQFVCYRCHVQWPGGPETTGEFSDVYTDADRPADPEKYGDRLIEIVRAG